MLSSRRLIRSRILTPPRAANVSFSFRNGLLDHFQGDSQAETPRIAGSQLPRGTTLGMLAQLFGRNRNDTAVAPDIPRQRSPAPLRVLRDLCDLCAKFT